MSLPLRKSALLAWTAALVLLVVICLALFGRRTDTKKVVQGPDSQPVAQPTTEPASKPAKTPEPKYVATYMDFIHNTFPAFAVTQPLAVPLNLSEAARLVIRDPVYFDASGSLIWITRPDAPPTETFLKKPPDDPERITFTRERPLFVHWLPDGRGWWPFLVVPAADSPGDFDLLSHLGRQRIGSRHAYDWGRAMSWNEKLVVPTDTGVSVFKFALDVDGRPVSGPNGPTPIEDYQDLRNPASASGPPTGPTTGPAEAVAASAAFAEPQVLLDWQGLLAFIPWDPGKQGGHGAARFTNDKWTTLGPAVSWPEYVLHLIPLRDGTVLQLVLTRPGNDDAAGKSDIAAADPRAWPVKLGFFDLDHAPAEMEKIRVLVAKLGDDDQTVRDAAFKELTLYGPNILPILKSLYDDAVPEAQARLKQLLRNQSSPLLGGMSLLGEDIRLVCRNDDGSAVFYSEKGVESAGPDGEPVVTAPAWLAVRPGHPVELLPASLTVDLKPEKARITAVVDEWVVTSDVRGPRRFIGNGFVKLLKKDEAGFNVVVGEDHRGRWLFRKPPAPAGAAFVGNPTTTSAITAATRPTSEPTTEASTEPTTTQAGAGALPATPFDGVETLIVDPTLPNLVPRLPVWNYTTADEVGWDRDDWPSVRQLGNVSRLLEDDWQMPSANPLLSGSSQAPAVPGPPRTQPAAVLPIFQTTHTPEPSPLPAATTAPAATTQAIATTEGSQSPQSRPSTTTAPATEAAATEPAEAPLWADPDGTKYFNGIDELRIVSRAGSTTTWTLPATATGKEPAHLVKTADGRLYLFNQPGRVLRIKATPGAAEPFVVEATFTHKVPNVDRPTRIWLDPAERIIIAYDKNLAILFPAGYFPPRIRPLISDLDDEDDDSAKP